MSRPRQIQRVAAAQKGALALLVLVACSPGARAPVRERLRLGQEGDVLALDPAVGYDDVTVSVCQNVLEPLVRMDRDMHLQPGLARSWRSPDENTWVFTLRSGVVRHDGVVLTAGHVRAALERLRLDPASQLRSNLDGVGSIDVTGELEVTIRTVKPDALLLQRVAALFLAWPPVDLPLGTGPYRYVSWRKGESVELEAFARHHGGPPPVPKVSFVVAPPGEASFQLLANGQLDVLREPAEHLVPRMRELPGVRVVSREGLVMRYLFLNALPAPKGRKNPLADARVRQALSLCLDRDELARPLLGAARPAHQITPEGVMGWGRELRARPRDVVEARRLLKEAGYSKGVDIPFAVPDRQAWSKPLGEAIAGMAAEAGIRLEVRVVSWTGELMEGWQRQRLPLFLAGWAFDQHDVSSFLRDCVRTRDEARGLGRYNAGFSLADVDGLIVASEEAFEAEGRMERYQRLMERLDRELPVIPLFRHLNLFAVRGDVTFEPRLDGRLLVADMR